MAPAWKLRPLHPSEKCVEANYGLGFRVEGKFIHSLMHNLTALWEKPLWIPPKAPQTLIPIRHP